MKHIRSKPWITSLLTAARLSGVCLAIAPPAVAQIVPDNTLPTPSSVEPGCSVCTIEGGTLQGDNLFHSFTEFSVPRGGEAVFNNQDTVDNIFSRVTGDSMSNIDGFIRANGTANVFLLNPNGIIFGPNAQLDIGGSFLASTADAIQFEDQVFYSASNPETSPLLTVSAPVGLQYGPQPTGAITNSGILEVDPSQSLALVGGDITLESGQLLAPGGRVELGGLTEAGTIELATDGGPIHLNFPNQISRGNVSLTNNAQVNVNINVDVTADNGGDIVIHGQDFESDGASLLAGIARFSGTPETQVGNITIDATGAVSLEQGAVVSNTVRPSARGNGGNITISADSLNLIGGGVIIAASFGQGDAGKITIDVREEVSISGVFFNSIGIPFSSGVSNTIVRGGRGDSGGINITVREGSLKIADGAGVDSSLVDAAGMAGDISIQVRDAVILDGVNALGFPSFISSLVDVDAVGQGGNISVTAETVSVLNGAEIEVGARGVGNAGTITIEASNAVILDGPDTTIPGTKGSGERVGGISAQVVRLPLFPITPPDEGAAGDINISTDLLFVTDGAEIQANTLNASNAGDIALTARDILIRGRSASGELPSGVFSTVQLEGEGRGGAISVEAESLQIIEGGEISTAVLGQGDAGDIELFVEDSIFLAGEDSGLFANAAEDTSGKGGNIIVDPSRIPDTIWLRDGASIAVDSQGSGEGGDIRLIADSILLEDNASISAETASNTGGDIVLDIDDLLMLRRGSQISTTAGIAEGAGDGGGIAINAQNGFIVAIPAEDSNIRADAFEGRGGNVNITAKGIFGIEPRDEPSDLSDITASSNRGVDGTVQISDPAVNPNQGLTELPSNLVDVSRLVAQGCDQPITTGQNPQGEFYNTRRGGITASPTAVLESADILEDLQPPEAWQADRPRNSPITEAQGWLRNGAGEVMLVAEASLLASQGRCWR